MICNECKTVAYCTKHGCIPKVKRTIDMAREAKAIHIHGKPKEFALVGNDNIKAFEALVRADERSVEREACAKVCESEADMFKSCAYGANDGRYDWKEDAARECAATIRERSANERARGEIK